MQFKRGVKLQGMRPELAAALQVCSSIAEAYGECVVTSVMEGTHAQTSKHKIGCAFDMRSKEFFKDHKHEILAEMRERLTDEFTVLLEDEDGPNEHYHVQFGKKGQVL